MAAVATITGQTRGYGLSPQGQAVQGFSVQFDTVAGQHGEVFVPDAQYTRANVQAAVRERAQEMDSILGEVS